MSNDFTKNTCPGLTSKAPQLSIRRSIKRLFKGPLGSSLNLPLNTAVAAMLTVVLSSCQMPSPTSSGSPMPSSSGGGSSGLPPSSPNPGGGMPSPGGSPTPSGGPPAGADGSSRADSGSGESTASLDETLDASLEEFDDRVMGSDGGSSDIDILSPSGSSGAIDSDEPLFEEAGEGGSDRSASVEQRAADGAPPGTEGNEGSGNQSASTAGQDEADIIPIPEDIDDGQGDDIVLRQIRDAASKEQDPDLREKLWDEYRRIKNQS